MDDFVNGEWTGDWRYCAQREQDNRPRGPETCIGKLALQSFAAELSAGFEPGMTVKQ
ncbi:hypothetical protein [Bradyrhizobium sp.]|uniref:hypothetical protein n=1 Tax=Bradyrhizobium sp. TaxID=376 RepID=UPI0039E62C7E